MIPSRALSGQVLVSFVLFSRLILAVLQNTTVDDAVLTGPTVPQYLPDQSQWNIGNNCTGCFVKPDPSLAYNGTWHDTTYSPNNSYTQEIEFTFTGSALYIFFIIANTVPYATTLTDVEFMLDGAAVSRYTHSPGTTTNYQYNVPVYVNESLPSGQHSMMIQPVNSGNNVLMLFDYLVYSTDTSSSASSSTQTASTSASAPAASTSATSTGTQGTSSGQNTGAIVGAVCGVLVVVITCLLCYRRYKRRNGGRSEEEPTVEPFYAAVGAAPASLVASPIKPPSSSLAELVSAGTDPSRSTVTPQSSILPSSTTMPSSSGARSSAAGIIEQVEQLRAEVARLRDLHEAPPEYSLGEAE